MGLIKRNEVYYLRIMIDSIEHRRSLHTKNKAYARKLYDQWIYQYQENKIKGSNFIPLISIEQKEIDFNRPSLKQAFKEHLRISKGNFVSNGSINSKELLLEHLNAQNIQWDNITPEQMLNFQEKLRLEYAPSTVDKFITHLKAFLKFAVKRNYFNEHDRVRLDFYKRSQPKKVYADSTKGFVFYFNRSFGHYFGKNLANLFKPINLWIILKIILTLFE